MGWWWNGILYIIFVVCFLVVFDSVVKVWIDYNIYFWGRVESRLIVYVWESGGCGSSGGSGGGWMESIKIEIIEIDSKFCWEKCGCINDIIDFY